MLLVYRTVVTVTEYKWQMEAGTALLTYCVTSAPKSWKRLQHYFFSIKLLPFMQSVCKMSTTFFCFCVTSVLRCMNVSVYRHWDAVLLPAVDKHRSHVRHLGSWWPVDKSENRQGVLWDTHVRPLGVMIMEHCPGALGPTLGVPFNALNER